MPVTRDNFDAPGSQDGRIRAIQNPSTCPSGAKRLTAGGTGCAPRRIDRPPSASPNRLRAHLSTWGVPQVLAYIKARLAADHRTRMGNFGEVVAAEHLAQRHNYRLAIFKRRFSDIANMPMRGEDVIAFSLTAKQRISRRCIAKPTLCDVRRSRSRARSSAPIGGPRSLSLVIASRLNDSSQLRRQPISLPKWTRLMERLGEAPVPTDHWIFLAFGKQAARSIRSCSICAIQSSERLHCVDAKIV